MPPVTLPLMTANGIQFTEYGLMYGSASSKPRPSLGNGTVIYPAAFIGLDNPDRITMLAVAERPLLVYRSMLTDVCLANSTTLSYRMDNLDIS